MQFLEKKGFFYVSKQYIRTTKHRQKMLQNHVFCKECIRAQHMALTATIWETLRGYSEKDIKKKNNWLRDKKEFRKKFNKFTYSFRAHDEDKNFQETFKEKIPNLINDCNDLITRSETIKLLPQEEIEHVKKMKSDLNQYNKLKKYVALYTLMFLLQQANQKEFKLWRKEIDVFKSLNFLPEKNQFMQFLQKKGFV